MSSLFVFLVIWLKLRRGSQINDEGTKKSCQETDPVDQDTLRRFSSVLRVLAVIREDHILVLIICVFLAKKGDI